MSPLSAKNKKPDPKCYQGPFFSIVPEHNAWSRPLRSAYIKRTCPLQAYSFFFPCYSQNLAKMKVQKNQSFHFASFLFVLERLAARLNVPLDFKSNYYASIWPMWWSHNQVVYELFINFQKSLKTSKTAICVPICTNFVFFRVVEKTIMASSCKSNFTKKPNKTRTVSSCVRITKKIGELHISYTGQFIV